MLVESCCKQLPISIFCLESSNLSVSSQAHFNSETREPRKIVFFVPKVPLVTQQYDLFSRNMEDNCKIYKLHGEADSDTPISDVIKNNDVLIMTPHSSRECAEGR